MQGFRHGNRNVVDDDLHGRWLRLLAPSIGGCKGRCTGNLQGSKREVTMNERALESAALWARNIKDAQKRGEDTTDTEFELKAFMMVNGLHSFLNINFRDLDKQLP